uniref:Uncharacterized protein n=1 Tax=Anguilla anguilla TaxID=7936 RepID=A0A0E9VPF2_ANGAN
MSLTPAFMTGTANLPSLTVAKTGGITICGGRYCCPCTSGSTRNK